MYQQVQVSDNSWRLLSGAISGAVSRSAVAPIERTIILKQTNSPIYANQSLIRAIMTMVRTEGISSMFRGNGANCLRIAPFQSIEFFLFDKLKSKYHSSNTNMLCFGALSGALATTLVYPFDLVKTLLAVQNGNELRGISGTIINVVRTNGFLGLFKGLSATLIGITPYASFKLTFFQILNQAPMKMNKDMKNLIFGGLAGCMALSITYPTDVIRRRLQFQLISGQQLSYFKIMKLMYRESGLRVFYRGLLATYAKVIPSTAIAFAINERLKLVRHLQ